MKLRDQGESALRFEKYVDGLASVIGHADRVGPLHDYCTGLVLPGERKSVEPLAGKTDPDRMAAQHQSLLHFVGQAEWSDERVLTKVREMVLPSIEQHGPIEAWIIDDTSFPKQGRHSVGVQHQYCGQLRRGKPLNHTGRRDEPHPISVKKLALGLPEQAWHTIRWREGSADWLSSRFARVRVRAAHGYLLPELLAEEWLLIEWPQDEPNPTKYWLSTLPADIGFRELVDLTKLRWRIERDYQELKQEVGLGHFEGRGWRGFHHHATLCIAAYGFLISEREMIPPLYGARCAGPFPPFALPNGYRPRGSAPTPRP